MNDNAENTIFIQIASLKKTEIKQTIRDCIEQAQYPKNLYFCIFDLEDISLEHRKKSNFKIIDIPFKRNSSTSLLKSQIQQYYNNEKYTLQLGSSHKFIKNWDTELITMLESLKVQGYKKPLLTTNLPSFNPKNDPSERIGLPLQINFKEFLADGTVAFTNSIMDEWEKLTSPVLGRFCGSHFYFADGTFINEVPNDPNYINVSEEISMSIRAFTWGYDIFHPNKVLIWHHYKQTNKKQIQVAQKSLERYYKLTNIKSPDVDLDIYGLGSERTLNQYEKYANISFKDKTSSETYVCSVEKKDFDYKITLSKNDFSTDPKHHNFWAVSFHNLNNFELYRKDARPEEILSSYNPNTETYTINRKFQSHQQPAYYSVWPNSPPNKWDQRIKRMCY